MTSLYIRFKNLLCRVRSESGATADPCRGEPGKSNVAEKKRAIERLLRDAGASRTWAARQAGEIVRRYLTQE